MRNIKDYKIDTEYFPLKLALFFTNELPDGVYHITDPGVHHLIAIKERDKWHIFDYAGN